MTLDEITGCVECGEPLRDVDRETEARAGWCSACRWNEHREDDGRCNDCHMELED